MKEDKLIALCQRHNAVVLNNEIDVLTIAVVDSPSTELMESLQFAVQKRIDIRCWTPEQMDKHQQVTAQPPVPVIQEPKEESGSAVEILNHTLQQALMLRASDIHFEPGETQYVIRLRVDGVLHALTPLPGTQVGS